MPETTKTKWNYRSIAVSCKAGDLLDEIARIAAINKGAFVEKLIEEAHDKIVKR